MNLRIGFSVVFFFIITNILFAQYGFRTHGFKAVPVYIPDAHLSNSDTAKALKKRRIIVMATEASLYGTTMFALNKLWYEDYPRTSFHFFNDSEEWLQMDKCGHLTTAYQVGCFGIRCMKWSGANPQLSTWYGGSLGAIFLSTVEILDGFSTEWGFSLSDMATNTLGAAAVIAQDLAWKDQRILIKFSYHDTPYASHRPNVLGSNFQERLLKDYNGLSCWASVNIYSFLKKESRFPKWLNVAVGYGAEGMYGGYHNSWTDKNGNFIDHSSEKRYRKYYLSLDLDLTHVPVKSALLRNIFNTISIVKFPAPALEYSKENGFRGFGFYF